MVDNVYRNNCKLIVLYMDRNNLAAANPQEFVDTGMQDNQAYATANEQVMNEEISPNLASGEVDVLNTGANEAYRTNIIIKAKTEDELYTEVNEACHIASEGSIAVTYEESSENGQPDDAEVFTKPNEAYHIPGSADMIESKENEAYGAVAEVFTKPNEAYHIPGSVDMIESKKNEAYGVNTEVFTKPNEAYHILGSVAIDDWEQSEWSVLSSYH